MHITCIDLQLSIKFSPGVPRARSEEEEGGRGEHCLLTTSSAGAQSIPWRGCGCRRGGYCPEMLRTAALLFAGCGATRSLAGLFHSLRAMFTSAR